MSQITWTYVDDNGYSHSIGLVHGDESGHVLVYCNENIVVIDFHVLTNKKYSFFIEEELCDVAIEEKEGKFSYGFSIDQVTDTPRNRGRKKMDREESGKALLMAAGFFAIVGLAVFLILHL
ncbi:MAG: hypothetical protein ABJC12_12220 [Saprospiraceae bacterium]